MDFPCQAVLQCVALAKTDVSRELMYQVWEAYKYACGAFPCNRIALRSSLWQLSCHTTEQLFCFRLSPSQNIEFDSLFLDSRGTHCSKNWCVVAKFLRGAELNGMWRCQHRWSACYSPFPSAYWSPKCVAPGNPNNCGIWIHLLPPLPPTAMQIQNQTAGFSDADRILHIKTLDCPCTNDPGVCGNTIFLFLVLLSRPSSIIFAIIPLSSPETW